jgi:hypothetical protein
MKKKPLESLSLEELFAYLPTHGDFIRVKYDDVERNVWLAFPESEIPERIERALELHNFAYGGVIPGPFARQKPNNAHLN